MSDVADASPPMQPDDPKRILFRFSHATAETQSVPASLLIQTLEGAQRVIWLLALAEENRDIKMRARIPSEIEQRYQLRCSVPKVGSYAMPAAVVSELPVLAWLDLTAKVMDRFEGLADAVVHADRDRVLSLVPDSAIRIRVLENLRSMAPRPGSGWRLDLNRLDRTVRFDDAFHAAWKRLRPRMVGEPETQTVNGNLVKIDFGARSITMAPLGMSRELDCHYDESLEDFLYENRRGPIQVTGTVILDEQNEPRKIVDVQSIAELDMSAFEISEVPYNQTVLRFKQPLVLMPSLDEESQQWMVLEKTELNIHVVAQTREALMEELQNHISMLWDEYAKDAEGNLSPVALALRTRLHAVIQEVPVAQA